MTRKNHVSNSDSHHNQSIKPTIPPHQPLFNHLNCIINIQCRLNEVNFNLNTFINMAEQQIQQLTHASGVSVEFINDDSLICRVATGSMKRHLGHRIDKNIGISGLCMTTHQIIRSDDIQNDTRIHPEEIRRIDARSLVVAPLFYEGHAAGVIKIASNKLQAFNDMDMQTIHIISGLISSAFALQIMNESTARLEHEKTHALDNLKKVEKKLKYIAQHDDITGMPNRSLFNEHLKLALAKAKRKKHLIVLMYMDIDHFKEVIDTMGHTFSDKLLHAFAQRLKQCTRSSDIAARFGGDEFILLIDDIKDMNEAIVIADKILQAVRPPFHLNNKSINITTSIGIAFLKDKQISVDDFIKQADQALYVSKNSGRNTYYIYDNELQYEPTQG